MFIALQNHTCALHRSAMCFGRPSYIPLLKERDRSGIWSYKHVAPPEQGPLIPMMTLFVQSQFKLHQSYGAPRATREWDRHPDREFPAVDVASPEHFVSSL
jgi:hypothetical protein